jgi:hypothetical protein
VPVIVFVSWEIDTVLVTTFLQNLLCRKTQVSTSTVRKSHFLTCDVIKCSVIVSLYCRRYGIALWRVIKANLHILDRGLTASTVICVGCEQT